MVIRKTYKALILITLLTISAQSVFAQVYGWSSIGLGSNNGTNGTVNAIVKFNNSIVFGGRFTEAGTLGASNVAAWDGSSWSALGSGVNDTVKVLIVFNGSLYAGGSFTGSGSTTLNHIAKWSGTDWIPLGTGLDGDADAFALFNGRLIIGGNFSNNGNNICAWDGASWSTLNTGVNNKVFTMAVVGGILYAGGDFTTAGGNSANKVASWNGSVWSPLGTGMNDRVNSLTSYGTYIAAGGRFTMAGSSNAQYLAQWNGAQWSSFTFQPDAYVNSVVYYGTSLIVGGDFVNVSISGNQYFVNKICKWDASGCTRMITGTNHQVKTMYVASDTIYAGGDFTSAGGDYSNFAAVWKNQPTHTISGVARYSDNQNLLRSGVVKAIRLDVSTREVIVIDSALIQPNGSYQIQHGISDSTDVILFPNDENLDNFVPTYYPSSLNWQNATKIFPAINLSSIDVSVIRAVKDTNSLSNISGHVYLNYNPVIDQPGFLFSKDAIVYAKTGNTYKQFAVSDSTEKYTLTGLNPGTYDLSVYRLGYFSDSRTVTLGTVNLDTINFYLDTAGVIGVINISSGVPQKFSLFQNYPNPFNPSTTIMFDLKSNSVVTLKVFDITGREVANLVNEELKPGEYKVSFNAAVYSSGIYFYQLTAGDFKETKKMILIK